MHRGAWTLLLLGVLAVACDADESVRPVGDSGNAPGDAMRDAGGRNGRAGRSGSGGASAAGASSNGGFSHAGAPASGGVPGTGGVAPTGGVPSTGGMATGGRPPAVDASASAGAVATGGAPGTGGVTYTTDFDLTESPLSENGAWHHDGLDWTVVDSGNGIAFGTQALGVNRSGPTAYDDSYAYLSGFPADHQASAVVHLGAIDGSCTHEVEILMRWADSAHVARGYECNVAFDGSYAQIVRWNGPVGDYTYLSSGSVPGGVHDGDTVGASVVGNTITLSVNGVVRATAQDSTFTTGNPGIAFWRGMSGCGTRGDYGFTSFTASSVGP